MVTRVLSVLRSADPGAPRPTDPVLDLNAYALAEDIELCLVLKAAGVELGVAEAHVRPATIAGIDVPAAVPERDLKALLASGVRIFAVEEDLTARGLTDAELVAGVQVLAEAELAALLTEHDVTLTWSIT